MKLERLTISLNASYDDNPGKYTGKAEYSSPHGELKIPLDSGFTEKLLVFLSPLIAEFGAKAAGELATIVSQAVEDRKHPVVELNQSNP